MNLQKQLKELFKFENQEFDFGVYRIMRYRYQEIEHFIDNELKLINNNTLKEKELYQYLLNFFSRYYKKGYLINKGHYNQCIVSNKEDVNLCWTQCNHYYVKTTEQIKNYTFQVQDLTVHFKTIKIQEEKGNVKSEQKKFFVLSDKVFDYDDNKKELNIYFEYRILTEKEESYGKSQNTVNKKIIKILEDNIPKDSFIRLIFEKDDNKTYIEKHLYKYTRKNTLDYFIHKDLKGFLEKELDTYIKNELLQLEKLKTLQNEELKDYLIQIDIFKNTALKIIDLLSKFENLQKLLWEKKKFVIETYYVITLDKIKEYTNDKFLENILDEVINNEKQKQEWKDLLHIEIKDKEELKKYKTLPIDTKYFDEEFKWKLLVALSENNNIDDILDGILIKSDNFQGLNLLLNKYQGKVQTIYIDPPFNKGQEDNYLYKVGYKDATWITMLENRIRLARELLNEKGSIFVRCDYKGNMYVRMLLNEIFGNENFRNEIIVKRGAPKAGLLTQFEGIRSIAVAYDNLYWYSKQMDTRFKGFYKEAPKEKQKRGFWTDFHKGEFYDRPTMRYEILGINIDKGQWKWKKERAYNAIKNYQEYLKFLNKTGKSLEEYWKITGKHLEFIRRKDNKIQYWIPPRETLLIDNNWLDITSYSTTTKFQTENSEFLLKRIIEGTSEQKDFILDFFLGSGTTTAVAHKLKRKWIGIEIGEHFYTIVLPRMKKVLFYNKSGISKEKDVREKYNENSAGGFFKYHILEQYEDILENIDLQKIENEKLFNHKNIIMEQYQSEHTNIDIIETFNYLFGLNIHKYKFIKHDKKKYLLFLGEKDGKQVVIMWRNIININLEKDKNIIDKFNYVEIT